MEVLKCIVQFKTKRPIFQHLFRDGSRFDRTNIWEVFNRLEKKRLIVTHRDYNRSIEGVSYLPELNNVLLDATEIVVMPPVNFLNLKLTKNPAKQTNHHADYAAVFTVESDVQLKAGNRYVYGAWVSKKGDINFQITPLAGVHHFPNQGFAGKEPLIIKEILERLLPLHDTTE